MTGLSDDMIIGEYLDFIDSTAFPCLAAKAARSANHIRPMVATDLRCPHDDKRILSFLYDFVDDYRRAEKLYHSAIVIFKGPDNITEETFSDLLWNRLQSISDLDSVQFEWDRRVANDPSSPAFSFSLKEEALYIIGLHSNSSRKARQFRYPALVFNPHQQFEQLRSSHKYEPMKEAVRKRDLKLSGSVNPMLTDFGETSEVFQYSGKQYDSNWKCPFVANHKKSEHNTSS